MGCERHTSDEGKNRLVAKAQECVPASSITTCRSGHFSDQPDIKGLGQLFSDRKFQPVFWIYQRLGGEKDQMSFDEVKKTPWLRLVQME